MSHTNPSKPASLSDIWESPQYLVNWLEEVEGCKMDMACTRANCKLPQGLAIEDYNALEEHWANHTDCGYINPPYSQTAAWVKKAVVEMQSGFKSVLVLKSGSDAEYTELFKHATKIYFIIGRIGFTDPETGQPVNNNPYGSIVVVYDPAAKNADMQKGIDFPRCVWVRRNDIKKQYSE